MDKINTELALEVHSVPLSDGEAPPSEFLIFAKGTTKTDKGDIVFDESSMSNTLEVWRARGTDLFIDYEHKSLDPKAPPGAGKAAAWFSIENRNGDLWATNVQWTNSAREEIASREWRYFSPAVRIDAKRRVMGVVNLGLTNLPATVHMKPLVAHQLPDENVAAKEPHNMKLYTSLVGLSETASELEIYTALSRLKEGNTELLSALDASSVEQAKGKIAGLQESAKLLPVVQENLAKANGELNKVKLEALFAKGEEEKKLTPAMKEWALSQSVEALSAFLEVAPAIEALSAVEEVEPPANEQNAAVASIVGSKKFSELSFDEKHELFQLDEKAYRALKAKES